MKYTNILIIALFACLISCSSENESVMEEALIDFSGIYEGKLNCTGELSDDVGEEIEIKITKIGDTDTYSIDMGDEIIFIATQLQNELIIEAQTVNEGQGFDEVSMVGEIRMIDEELMFDCTYSVDDEGESTCSIPLIKK